MNLLDRLKLASASAIDAMSAMAESYGADMRISIVISHPSTVEDAFIVGEHETAELFAILTRIATGPAVECDVTATAVGPTEPAQPSRFQ